MMFLGLRYKITITYSLLFCLILSGLGIWLAGVFSQQYENSLETRLKNDASLTAGFISRAEPELLDEVASQVSEELGVRVTIINSIGQPLAETARPVEELENHIERPEIQAALRGELGESRRYSATVGADLLYVAAPFHDSAGQIAGVVRLSYSLKEIQFATRRIRLLIFGALMVGLGVSLVLGWLITGAATRSLAVLSRRAKDFGQGSFSNHREIRSRDEIGQLEMVFNEMAARVISSMAKQDRERIRVEQILRSLPVGVLVVDRAGTLVAANDAAGDILNANPAGINKSLIGFTRNWDINAFVSSLLSGRDPGKQEMAISNGEGRKHILLQGAPVPAGNQGTRDEVVVVLQDVTGIRQLEQQRRDLVANVSHELRTPLTAIQGFAETLLEEKVDDATAQHFIEIIRQESLRLSRLLNDLLNLSRLESGSRRKQGITRLKQAAEDVAGLLRELARARGKDLIVDIAGDILVSVDRDYVEQILMNYIDNALKYTPEGTEIRVGAEVQDDGFARLFVLDNGPGIPPQEQKRLFERFFRVDKSRGREAGGTGLGLAIVKHIVEGFGGGVGVVSYPGSGTSFWATLPLKKD